MSGTPTPWKLGTAKKFRNEIMGTTGRYAGLTVATVTEFVPEYRADSDANAALIVRAVNNHDALIELAHQYASDLRHPPTADSRERRLERIAAVLAKAGAA